MRIFYDTEFIDDGRTIDLISIGMCKENGETLYLQNSLCAYWRANEWVKTNVYPHLMDFDKEKFSPQNSPMNLYWALPSEIAEAVTYFCHPPEGERLELWGYYSAYDHVALAQLFGSMIDLPRFFPMYTRDIKQWCDQLGNPHLPEQTGEEHNALQDAMWVRQAWEFLRDYEHSVHGNGCEFFGGE